MTNLDQGRTTDPLEALKDSPNISEEMVEAVVERHGWRGVVKFLEYLQLVKSDAVGFSLPYGLEPAKIDTLTVPEYLRSWFDHLDIRIAEAVGSADMAGILTTKNMRPDAKAAVGRQITRKRAIAASIRNAGPGFLRDVQDSSVIDAALAAWPDHQEPALNLLRDQETQLRAGITRGLNILTHKEPSPLALPFLSERESSGLTASSIRDSAHYSIVRNLLRRTPAK